MKIIQIIAKEDGLYGLSDDGTTYKAESNNAGDMVWVEYIRKDKLMTQEEFDKV